MKRKALQNAIGISAVAVLVILFAVVFFAEKKDTSPKTQPQEASGTITFDKDEIVYDGTGSLDLMEGVVAKDSSGNNVNDKVDVMLTGDSTLNRKTVRYTFLDKSGASVSAKRTLVMKNYNGPSLNVEADLVLKADDLGDLINVLKNKGSLSAEDGYGRDITSQVKCVREKKANGEYTMEFTVVNGYEDSKSATATAFIEGDVPDPEIKLSEKEVTLRKTEFFDPLRYVVFASDTVSHNATGEIQVTSSVQPSVPGKYKVVYRLYSADKTAITTEVLKVSITGD